MSNGHNPTLLPKSQYPTSDGRKWNELDREEQWQEFRSLTIELGALKAENARLRKALAFYADNENWYREYELTRDSGMSPVYVPIERSRIEHDSGTIAREALQEAQS